MNLNGIAQACLERNHCRFFSFRFYLFSCDWRRKWKREREIPRAKRLTCLVVLQYYSTTGSCCDME